MAIAVGSVVALKVACTGLTFGSVNPQPPLFGVSEGASPSTIIWYNGNSTTAVAAALVDEILDAGPTTLEFVGQVVSVEGYSSPAYSALVLGAYKRSGVDCLLLKTLSGECFIEIVASNAVVVVGQ
jgi:hypothetical protein